jgi:hypothetical protein
MVNELLCFGLPGVVCYDVLDRLTLRLISATTDELDTFLFVAELDILVVSSCFAFPTSMYAVRFYSILQHNQAVSRLTNAALFCPYMI